MKRLATTLVLGILLVGSAAGERGIKLTSEAEKVVGTDAPVPAYHALVIGINRYQHWQDLRQARPDAEAVAELLKTRYGFRSVLTLYNTDATKDRINNEFRRYARSLKETDALLVFYAGHGFFDKVWNSGYWIPADARERVDGEPATADWLSNSDLKRYISNLKARHVLVISDSCFSGALFRGGTPDLSAKENAWYRQAMAQPSRWGISSGDLETVPDQSVFARKVVAALKYPLKPVFSASDLAGRIKVEVAADTGCQPLFGRLADDNDSKFGEFVFLSSTAPGGAAGVERIGPLTQPVSPTSGPSVVQYTGGLVVESPERARVMLDGGTAYDISPGKGLRWDSLPVGTHEVAVVSRDKRWSDTVVVQRDQTVTARASFGPSPGDDLTVDLGGGVKMEFVWIKALNMWVGKYEVTNEQYRRKERGHDSTDYKGHTLNGDKQPVVYVNIDDAKVYAEWMNRTCASEFPKGYRVRLPSEQEWQTFAQCGDGREYPWGDNWPPRSGQAGNYHGQDGAGLWSKIDGYRDGHPVTCDVEKSWANPWGLYGVGGNVWEVCASDSSGGSFGAWRGASWSNDSQDSLRCSFRIDDSPSYRSNVSGFRFVLSR